MAGGSKPCPPGCTCAKHAGKRAQQLRENPLMHRPDVRAKVSAAHAGKPRPWRAGDKNPMFGKPLSPEHRAKIGAAQAGAKNHLWKGDDAGQRTAHDRIARRYGPAAGHPCIVCENEREVGARGEDAMYWSYDGYCRTERRDATDGGPRRLGASASEQALKRVGGLEDEADLAQPDARQLGVSKVAEVASLEAHDACRRTVERAQQLE